MLKLSCIFVSVLLCFQIIPHTLCAASAGKKASSNESNLVFNGDFESGSNGRTPKGWAPFDGITQLLGTREGAPGCCLILDTNVLQKDKKDFVANEQAYKNRTKANKGGKYDVVGAHEGAWAYAAPIDVGADDEWFVISADVFSPARGSTDGSSAMILIRGFVPVTENDIANGGAVWFHSYFGSKNGGYEDMFGSKDLIRKPQKGDWRMVYRTTMFCRNLEVNRFEHFEQAFKLPKDKRHRPTRLLIKPYAFWPPGKYRFDNIALRRCTAERAKEINEKRLSVNTFK